MITLSAKLDATKQAHGRVTPLYIFKHEWIEIFHRNPTEYSSGFFYIVSTPTNQLTNQIGEGFLVFLSNTNRSGVNFGKFVRIPAKLREIELCQFWKNRGQFCYLEKNFVKSKFAQILQMHEWVTEIVHTKNNFVKSKSICAKFRQLTCRFPLWQMKVASGVEDWRGIH